MYTPGSSHAQVLVVLVLVLVQMREEIRGSIPPSLTLILLPASPSLLLLHLVTPLENKSKLGLSDRPLLISFFFQQSYLLIVVFSSPLLLFHMPTPYVCMLGRRHS